MSKTSLIGAVAAAMIGSSAAAQNYDAIARDLFEMGYEHQATVTVKQDSLSAIIQGSVDAATPQPAITVLIYTQK